MGKGMRNILSGYYRPSDDEFKELWEKAVFILDTNVLLNLYRYPKESRDELMKILKKLSDSKRLWIPYQVALEYQNNLLNVISEQEKLYGGTKKLIEDMVKDLNSKFDILKLKERHSSINPEKFLNTMKDACTKFLKELEPFEKGSVKNNDKLRDEIDKLLEGKIGLPPSSQNDLDNIYAEGEKRHINEIPPGYAEEKKTEEFMNNGLFYKRKYGDLILWKQIIEEAKKRDNCKYLIFVTDDGKPDWWLKKDGNTIGPKPELVSEIVSNANLSLFYMYRQEEFMEYAKQYLGAEVSEESIKQVRDIGNTLKTTWNINDALIYGNSVVNFIPPAGVASLAFADGRYVNDSALGATVKSQYSLDPKQYDLWNPDGTLRRAGDNVYATFDTGYESPEEKLRKDVEELKKELKEIRDKQSKNE